MTASKNKSLRLAVFCGIATGGLHGLSWPRWDVWPLAFVYLTPLIWFWRHHGTGFRRWSLTAGACAAFVSTSIGFYWLSYMAQSFGGFPSWLSPVVVLLYALVAQGHYFLVALSLRRWPEWMRRSPLWWAHILTLADWAFPKIFCDTEGTRLIHWFHGAQGAELFGVYGLSWICNFSSASLALFDFQRWKQERSYRRMQGVVLGSFLVALLLLDVWGGHRLQEIEQMQTRMPKLKVAVVQANIGDADKVASEQGGSKAIDLVLGTYAKLSQIAVLEFKPDLLIWPETAYPFLYTHFKDPDANLRGSARDAWMAKLFSDLNVPAFFFGGYSAGGDKEFNSMILLEKPLQLQGIYQKNQLLAFGEYVPLGPLSDIVAGMIPAIGHFGRGPGPSTYPLSSFRMPDGRTLNVGPLICYESIIPWYPRETVQKGADVLVNITNDSWFGDTSEPYSHLDLTRFRSIELRRPLVRATNTGFTTLVDFTGALPVGTSTLFKMENLYLSVPVALEDQQRQLTTLYSRFGDGILLTLGLVMLLPWGFVFRRSRGQLTF